MGDFMLQLILHSAFLNTNLEYKKASHKYNLYESFKIFH